VRTRAINFPPTTFSSRQSPESLTFSNVSDLVVSLVNEEKAKISKKNKIPPHTTLAEPMPCYDLTFFDLIQVIGLKSLWRHEKQQITQVGHALQLYSIIKSNGYNIFELFIT
jgi:hypothetical protein